MNIINTSKIAFVLFFGINAMNLQVFTADAQPAAQRGIGRQFQRYAYAALIVAAGGLVVRNLAEQNCSSLCYGLGSSQQAQQLPRACEQEYLKIHCPTYLSLYEDDAQRALDLCDACRSTWSVSISADDQSRKGSDPCTPYVMREDCPITNVIKLLKLIRYDLEKIGKHAEKFNNLRDIGKRPYHNASLVPYRPLKPGEDYQMAPELIP